MTEFRQKVSRRCRHLPATKSNSTGRIPAPLLGASPDRLDVSNLKKFVSWPESGRQLLNQRTMKETHNMKLVLLGGGGHASDMLGLLEDMRSAGKLEPMQILIADDQWQNRTRFNGRDAELIDGLDSAMTEGASFIVSVGYPGPRRALVKRALQAGMIASPARIHPTAHHGHMQIGVGSAVLCNATLSPLVEIGEHCYISHGTLIGHDTQVGNFTSIMPGVNVSGDVKIADGVLIGTGATILQGIEIGANAIVGAGAVVTKNVMANTTVVGMPAKSV